MNEREEQQREQQAPQHRLEELLELIRGEARYLEQEEGASVPREVAPLPLRTLLPWREDADILPQKSLYHVNEFLVYDDIDFVANAFRGILQREPDETGIDGYTAQLRRHGEPFKVGVLLDLMGSEEGRRWQVEVQGLSWLAFEFRNRGKHFFKSRKFRKVYTALRRWFASDLEPHHLEAERRRRREYRRVSRHLADQGELFDYLRGRERKLEGDQRVLLARLERARRDMLLERRELLAQQQRVNLLLERLGSVASAADADKAAPTATAADLEGATDSKLDAFYLAFENECRGDEAAIRAQLSVYLHWLEDDVLSAEAPLLDIGSGRGEWLALLRDRALPARGVDISPLLADHCHRQNLDVTVADALEHLREQPDNSLGAVTAFHIVEHLPFEYLFSLVEECHRVLVPGGPLILETPNPENVLVGSHTFYHDPTHRNPLTPTLAEFLLRHLGFVDLRFERLHPYPAGDRVAGDDPLADRVNGAFCGPQDFGLIGYKTGYKTGCKTGYKTGDRTHDKTGHKPG